MSFRFKSRYLLPGLKRWILAFAVGVFFIGFGIALVLKLRPFTIISQTIWAAFAWVADTIPAHISGPSFLVLGTSFILVSLFLIVQTILNATANGSSQLSTKNSAQSVLQALENVSRQGQGPKIVAIGGGTGLSTLLRGLKNYSSNISAIVTVGDDGGSSGRLREELKVVPPGDIRNCIVALSDEEEITTSLFQYRFSEGSLKGHNLGNLFLAALCNISGDMSKASQVASRILRIRGKVLPASSEAIHLCAELNDSSIIEGESKIPKAKHRIGRIFANDLPPALPETISEIKDAELIVLGPGSLFTSIIPNLIFPEIVQAIKESKAKVLYVCNLVEDFETTDFSVTDFLEAINKHVQISSGSQSSTDSIIDAVLVNAPDSFNIEGKPIAVNLDEIYKLGIEVTVRNKLHDANGRHNSLRLARSIMQWFNFNSKQQASKEINNQGISSSKDSVSYISV